MYCSLSSSKHAPSSFIQDSNSRLVSVDISSFGLRSGGNVAVTGGNDDDDDDDDVDSKPDTKYQPTKFTSRRQMNTNHVCVVAPLNSTAMSTNARAKQINE